MDPTAHPSPRRIAFGTVHIWLASAVLAGVAYYLIAYQLLPMGWRYGEHRHPALQSLATRAVTREGIPGDPINLAIIADESQLHRVLLAHGWMPADPVTWRAAARIAADSVFHRPYDTAPVSNLYFWDHQQDLSFEQMIGDPRRRHHVRFWRSTLLDSAGRPLWAAAATLDTHAGISHLTGQITHHIDAAIDRERDKLVTDLRDDKSTTIDMVDGFQTPLHGRNGGGDPYYTDGRLALITLN